ncbi:MAG: tail fiber domain-containing protein [Saprospiraceae bacterium]|nr:tail fiber domain-containing protein [Saprospiraceae bacterium]
MELVDNVLPALDKINTYQYNWKDSLRSGKLQTGLIAQQVEMVLPQLVSTNDEGIKSVNYPAVNAVLVQALKELKAEQNDLDENIGKLEKRLNKLKVKLKEKQSKMSTSSNFQTSLIVQNK